MSPQISLREGKEILISVTDTGPGIDPAILPNIFEAFVTNKEGGTGLGLAIVHEIVIKHGGRIEVAKQSHSVEPRSCCGCRSRIGDLA